MGILEVRNVTQRFNGTTVLDNLSIDFWQGHIHAVIGPNGAGKSTLAHTIMGLHGYEKHEGQILLDGLPINGLPVEDRAKRGISLAWQEPARFEGLTVRQFVLAGAENKSTATLDEALQWLGLSPETYANRCVDKTLSGGERKRIEMASIVAMNPRLVLMDEPDSGIDVSALDRIFDTLDMLKQKGATIVLITHSLTVLEHADHAFLMCHGQLLDKGSIEKIGGYFRNKCLPCDHVNQPELGELQ